MSLNTLVEATIHLESFRNIELFYQGLYFLKCRLYWEKNMSDVDDKKSDGSDSDIKKEYASPYCSFISHIQVEKQAKILKKGGPGNNGQQHDHHNLLAHRILDDECAFRSKTFLIRYCEEEVEINDIVLFRAEIDVEPEYLNTDFFLEVELHFSNLDSIGGQDQW